MSEGSRIMNEALLTGRYRGHRTGGLIDRLSDTDMGDGRSQRLNEAVARFEAASRAGDEIAREMADAQIDAILDEGRAVRQQAAAEVAPPVTSFDGGLRRSPVGVRRDERLSRQSIGQTPSQLMQLAFRESERRSRAAVRVPSSAHRG